MYDAVHGLAFDDADVAVCSAVVVMPRREKEEIAAAALFCKSVGRMITVGEAIVLQDNDRVGVREGGVYDGLLSFGDTRRYKHSTLRCFLEAALHLLRE